jgi:Reverse transcriptase (RNA-dependent DNA polymerase)
MSSRRKLAKLLNFDLSRIEALAAQPMNFRIFEIDQDGKKRTVEVPKVTLEKVHRRLFTFLERLDKPAYLHSGRKKCSYITNASAHMGVIPVVKLDLKKFYPSVDAARVYRFFTQSLRCSDDVGAVLTKLCTVNGHLPTGSCLSQLLAFFSAKPMFDELDAHACANHVNGTCYVDDLTWSGINATPAFLWRAKQIVHRHGFRYHKDKCYQANEPKIVTGVRLIHSGMAVQQGRELAIWRSINDLGGLDEKARLNAFSSLIGKAVASSQIDIRFLQKVKFLRRKKAALVKKMAM